MQILSVLIAIVIAVGIIMAIMVWKKKKDYRIFVKTGIIVVVASILLMFIAFLLQIIFLVGIPFLIIGVIYLVIGLVNMPIGLTPKSDKRLKRGHSLYDKFSGRICCIKRERSKTEDYIRDTLVGDSGGDCNG